MTTHSDRIDRSPHLKPRIKDLWVRALRSGQFEQNNGSLGYIELEGVDLVSGEDGPFVSVIGPTSDIVYERHCCLGVLCVLAGAEGVVLPSISPSAAAWWRAPADPHDHCESVLPEAVARWAGLVRPDGKPDCDPFLVGEHDDYVDFDEDTQEYVIRRMTRREQASSFNDDLGHDFERIADWIERTL